MADSHVKRSRGPGQRNAAQIAALDEFVRSAGAMHFQPALGSREAAFLTSSAATVR